MKPLVLLAPRMPAPFEARLRDRFTLLGPMQSADAADLPPGAEAARALVTLGSLGAGAALIAALPALEVICCYGTGFEGVDRAAAAARGIAVTNAGEANAETVAEFAMGAALAIGRRIAEGDRYVRARRWRGNAVERLPMVQGLFGRRLGIYGLGAIGRRIATRGAAFGMEIGYHNRRPAEGVGHACLPSLHALAEWSDVLMVSVRAGPENRHAVDAAILATLGPGGFLVNIARGSVVDTAALCDALEGGAIAGAALDVFENEPEIPERLRVLENVVLTPHIAAFAASAQAAQQDMVMANLDAFFAGRPLVSPV